MMFNCKRCGSSFSPERAASIGNCPRCRARDGVSAPLYFKVFDAVPTATVEAEVDDSTGSLPTEPPEPDEISRTL
jgi:uncharacterized OB-fold protein